MIFAFISVVRFCSGAILSSVVVTDTNRYSAVRVDWSINLSSLLLFLLSAAAAVSAADVDLVAVMD
jgi:hypothetical protein